MKRLFAIGLSAAALAGCATTGDANDAPMCSGKNRRPINIYPSALPNMNMPTPVGSPFASVPLSTPTVAGPMPTTSAPVPMAPRHNAPPIEEVPATTTATAIGDAVLPTARTFAPPPAPAAADNAQGAAATVAMAPPPSPAFESCE